MLNAKNASLLWLITLWLLVLLCLTPVACGKKGPPVAPRTSPFPVVNDLLAKGEGNLVRLVWTMPAKPPANEPQVAGFYVNRSKTAIAQATCTDCPLTFERIADIPAANGAPAPGKPQFSFTDQVEKGFRYFYQVQVVTTAREEGPESNRVEILY